MSSYESEAIEEGEGATEETSSAMNTFWDKEEKEEATEEVESSTEDNSTATLVVTEEKEGVTEEDASKSSKTGKILTLLGMKILLISLKLGFIACRCFQIKIQECFY